MLKIRGSTKTPSFAPYLASMTRSFLQAPRRRRSNVRSSSLDLQDSLPTWPDRRSGGMAAKSKALSVRSSRTHSPRILTMSKSGRFDHDGPSRRQELFVGFKCLIPPPTLERRGKRLQTAHFKASLSVSGKRFSKSAILQSWDSHQPRASWRLPTQCNLSWNSSFQVLLQL